jgi:hypothetical protein
MSRKFLTGIDLSKNELLNARVQNLSSDPVSPVEGQIYYNTTSKRLLQYNGSAWKTYTTSGDIVNADISASAAIALSKLATDPLDRANHTGTQTASTISDFNTAVQTNRLDQMAAPTASVSLNSQKITNLAAPTADADAATKAYVDASRSGLDVKDSVRVATTAAGTLATSFANGSTVDGVTLATGNRILIKNQASASENGIYTVNATGAPTRATDADTSAEVTSGMFTFVTEGTANDNSGWVLTTNDPITLGTTELVFAQFSGAGQISAGNGLTKTGNTIDVVGTADRITANSDSIDIASTYVGQTSITTLGTIATGTWNATTIGVAKGGTGATTLTGYVKGNGTSAFTAAATVPTSDITGTLSVANGGTGATTLNSGGYLKGAGTSAITSQTGIPGADVSGNIAGNAANVTGTVAIANGGTGSTTASDARAALSATTKYAVSNSAITVSSGVATWTVTHSLGSQDVIVQVRVISTNELVEVDVALTSTTVATLSWVSAANVPADTYRVVVIG